MRLKSIAIALRNSMWFIPTLMTALFVTLAYSCINIDNAATVGFAHNYPQPFAGGADSVRMMLSAIATSMITVSGITFSLTISSLAQTSSQLTARVLRNFMSNLTNKLVLGFFVGLFAYCIVVIRTIRIKDDAAGPFIPALSVFVAMGLALIGIAVLIYFVHYVALSVQATTVVSSILEETLTTLNKLYPDSLTADAEETPPTQRADNPKQAAQLVLAAKNGYVQLIDESRLRQFALNNACQIQVNAGTGDYVTAYSPLVSLVNFAGAVDDSTVQAINQAYSIQATRTIDEELAYGIRQLVDIGLKVLGPASNDPTTAVLVLDNLSAVLVQLVQRRVQPLLTEGTLLPKHPSFANLMDGALDQIRDAAGGNTVVLTRLLLLLQVVSRCAPTPARRAVLLKHTQLVAEQADATLHNAYQRSLVRQQLNETLLALGQNADELADLLQPLEK